jgi:hypothetical protein
MHGEESVVRTADDEDCFFKQKKLLGNLDKGVKGIKKASQTRDTSRPKALAFIQSMMTRILLRVLKHMLRYALRQKM